MMKVWGISCLVVLVWFGGLEIFCLATGRLPFSGFLATLKRDSPLIVIWSMFFLGMLLAHVFWTYTLDEAVKLRLQHHVTQQAPR